MATNVRVHPGREYHQSFSEDHPGSRAHKIDPRDVEIDIEHLRAYEPERLNRSRGQLRRHAHEEVMASTIGREEEHASWIRRNGTTAILFFLFIAMGALTFVYYYKVYRPIADAPVSSSPGTPTPVPPSGTTPPVPPSGNPPSGTESPISEETRKDLDWAMYTTGGIVMLLSLLVILYNFPGVRSAFGDAVYQAAVYLGVKAVFALAIVSFFVVMYVRARGRGPGLNPTEKEYGTTIAVAVVLGLVVYAGMRESLDPIRALFFFAGIVAFAVFVVSKLIDYSYEEAIALDPNAKPRPSWKMPTVLAAFPLLAMLLGAFSLKYGVTPPMIANELLSLGIMAFAAEYYLMYYYSK